MKCFFIIYLQIIKILVRLANALRAELINNYIF